MTTSSAGSATKRHGKTWLKARPVVNSETHDYSQLENTDTYLLKLLTRFVLSQTRVRLEAFKSGEAPFGEEATEAYGEDVSEIEAAVSAAVPDDAA
jgi:uncharacterized iron-regulated protein